MKNETIYIENENGERTGYSLSVRVGMTTGQVGSEEIPAIQGGLSSISPRDVEAEEYIFPESREEHFLDEKLLGFYKKRGYK